jgi:ABC-type uncharacterized transport system permease subunit
MNATIIAFLSIGLFGLGTFYEASTHLSRSKQQTRLPLFLGIAAVAIQAVILFRLITAPQGDAFSLSNSAAITSCIAASLVIGISFFKPTQSMIMFAYPAALVSLIILLTADPHQAQNIQTNKGILAHISLSILAYSILLLAAIQALLVSIQNKNLKHHGHTKMTSKLPPLLVMENILFDLLKAGTLLLAAAIAIGLVFVDDFLAQRLAHKTFFSILALMVFTTLWFGRARYGWRGAFASRMTLWGTSFLIVGFFGSKLVLESIS